MKCKKIMASFLLIVMLVTPLSAYADTAAYAYSDEEVLERGRLYYSYLEQVFGNIVKENEGASEVTLTGAIGFCNTDYLEQSEFDAKVQQGKIGGPSLYIEYRIGNEENAYYISDLLPAGSPTTVLAKSNYTDAVKEMDGSKAGAEILGNGFVKIGGDYCSCGLCRSGTSDNKNTSRRNSNCKGCFYYRIARTLLCKFGKASDDERLKYRNQ